MPLDKKQELETKLEKLIEASDQLLNTVFQADRQVTLQRLTKVVFESLNPESCGVFLVDRSQMKAGDPADLVLEAEYPPQERPSDAPLRLRIESKRGGGLTGHLASQGEVRSLCAKDLEESYYRTDRKPTHHKSGRCYSWLFIPLKDRKDHLIGAISVYNKLAADNKPNAKTCFDDVDLLIARILAGRILPVLLGMRTFAAFSGLMAALRAASDLNGFLDEILKVGLSLVGAERGDFVWAERGRLIIRATVGDGRLKVGDPLPEKSVIHRVWRTGERAVEPNVANTTDYLSVNSSIRSEVAVPVRVHERILGVLNAESRTTLDERDVELLALLARYAEVGAQLLQRQEALKGLDRSVAEQSAKEVLRGIVHALQEIFQFESIVYVADYPNKKLRCIEAARPKGLFGLRVPHFLRQRRSATKVFRQQQSLLLCRPAKNDPDVNLAGIEHFEIQTPMVGLPLLIDNNCWGVAGGIWRREVWSSGSPPGPIGGICAFGGDHNRTDGKGKPHTADDSGDADGAAR